MPSELTAGFDVAAQIGEKAVEKVYQAYYESGTFPNYVVESYQSGQEPATVEVFFGPPSLQFVSHAGLPNPVRLTFPFLFRLSNDVQEYSGSTAVVAATSKDTKWVEDGPAVVITVDFSGLGDHLFEFVQDDWTLASNPESFPPEFEDEIKPVIISSLKVASTKLQISPTLIHANGFFTAQTYLHPPDTNFLGVFVKHADVDQDPPGNMAPYPGVYPGSTIGNGIAIPADTVNASIQQNLIDMGLDPDSLPSPMPGDPDRTVYKMNIQLRDGHLKVTGDVDDVEFTAKLGLKSTGSGLETFTISVDFDLPWYMDIADVFSGGALTRFFEEELPKSLGGLSQSVAGLGFVADALPDPSIPGNPVTIRVELAGPVTIRTTGLILRMSVTPEFEAAPEKKPSYVKGNKETKEFHRGASCPYGKKLKWQKTKYLLSEAAAIRQGYNGCWTCAREYSHPAGRVMFFFRSTGHTPGESIHREIIVEGKLMQAMTIDGVEVTDPPFETGESYSKNVDEAGVWKASNGYSSNMVQPGLWRFTARSGDWSGECEFYVKPTARNYGATNYVTFSIGSSDGNFGYDEMPPFP